MITRYYRLPKNIAIDLEKLLPELIQPETWRSATRPDANGTIRTVASKSELVRASPSDSTPKTSVGVPETVIIPNSVLIIRQSRETHEAIAKLINKVQFGDAVDSNFGGIGGGMMGGGMGGGGRWLGRDEWGRHGRRRFWRWFFCGSIKVTDVVLY